MEFKKGDRVEHKNRGKGTFVCYDIHENESVVEFDLDSDGAGMELTVSTSLLRLSMKNKDEIITLLQKIANAFDNVMYTEDYKHELKDVSEDARKALKLIKE